MSKLKKASAFGVCLVSVIVGLVYDSEDRSSGIIISENGARETGDEEGCRNNPYQCAAKEWTFGIGAATTGGDNVIIGKTYTNEEIADQYAKDLRKVSKCIIDYYPYNEMNQNQIDALGSLIFNIGCQGSRFYLDRESGRFKKTQLYKAAIDKDFIRMCNTFPNYSRVNGKVHKSILKRRLRERDLCLSPVNKV